MSINYETINIPASECFRVLRWGEDVNQVEIFDSDLRAFKPMTGTGGRWHWHPEVEITLVETGNGIRVVGDETREISTGSNLVVLGRGLPHYWQFNGPSSGVCVQFCNARLMETLTERARAETLEFINRAAFGMEIHAPHYSRAISILRSFAENPASHYLEKLGLLYQLLGALANVDVDNYRQISSIRFDTPQGNANYMEMQKAVNWIMENYRRELQLSEILDMVQMSKASFSRHFLKCTGVSFSQFVNQVRISNASRLLHVTEESICSIAFETGFSNLSNFNRIFRKLKGKSPSDYRKGIQT